MSWKQVNDITFNAPTTFCSRNYRIGWKLSLFKPLLCDDGNTIFKCKSPLWTLFLLKCLHLHNFTVEKSQTNATSVILQTFWEHIWKHTVENIQTNAKDQSPFEPHQTSNACTLLNSRKLKRFMQIYKHFDFI